MIMSHGYTTARFRKDVPNIGSQRRTLKDNDPANIHEMVRQVAPAEQKDLGSIALPEGLLCLDGDLSLTLRPVESCCDCTSQRIRDRESHRSDIACCLRQPRELGCEWYICYIVVGAIYAYALQTGVISDTGLATSFERDRPY